MNRYKGAHDKKTKKVAIKEGIIDFLSDSMKMTMCSLYMVVAMIIVLICVIIGQVYAERSTDKLADNIIRFHVVANSDSSKDQMMKQQVKDEVIKTMQPVLSEVSSIYETRCIIEESLLQIEDIGKEVVAQWGSDYSVKVILDRANFPTKSYGDVVLPAGEYEACRVIIGEGKGENWWCVMFPPLCYVDASSGVVPLEGKEELQQELTEEQYKLVTSKQKPYQIKFKIIDCINAFFKPSNYKEIR